MNGKGMAAVWILIAIVAIIGGIVAYGILRQPAAETTVGTTVQEITQAATEGDVASVKVYVRDLANDNINTKVAAPVYCMADGDFIIDATTSSTTTEITGQTARGKTVTCWAFNASLQTLTPSVTVVDEEVEHIVIDGYTIGQTVNYDIFDETFTIITPGTQNITITSADGTDTYEKLRIKNNNSNQWIPLGGIYFDTATLTNISLIEIDGTANVKAKNHGTTSNIVASTLTSKVSTRKTKWDYVFEMDDSVVQTGNKGDYHPLLLEEDDYVETFTVKVTADAACSGGAMPNNNVTVNAFTKGFYRSTQVNNVLYGHETDAVSAAVISPDYKSPEGVFYCSNAG